MKFSLVLGITRKSPAKDRGKAHNGCMERVQFDKDVKPISEFRANAPSLIEQVHRTKRLLVITQHGKSAAILLDVQEYEAMLLGFSDTIPSFFWRVQSYRP